ncbi:MAG: ABC transporter substrate-binding protein [Coleofasciculaceae cyanobacterium SM2_1_6]|nr:ABC transporter substrate-binding protein [Coleofasciculaceae cyanobacterium SM2_1_6]
MIQKILQWLQTFFRVSIPKGYKLLAFGGSIALILWLIYALWFSPHITLGLIAPLSGDFAVLAGREMVTGAELAVAQANQAGGVVVGDRRYPVRLLIADDENKPEAMLQAAEQLQNKGVQALITSPQSSLNSLLVAALAIEDFPLPLITSATDPVITFQSPHQASDRDKNIISIGLDQELQGAALADFAVKTLQAKNAAILYNSDHAYSRNLVTAFQRNFQDLGGRVMTETYQNTRPDFLDRLQSLNQQQPDVLLLPNPLPDLISQGLALQKLAIDFPVIGGDSWAGIISANLPLLEGGFFLSPWHPQLSTPENQKFIADYTNIYRQAPRSNAALAYDAVQMILGAIATQGEVSPEAIERGILASSPFLGITGQILDPVDRGRSMVINQVKNGEATFYQQVAPVPKIPQ